MEIETALRRHLLSLSPVRGYVGEKVWKHKLLDSLDGTGGRAVVIRRTGGWGDPDLTQSSEYPLITLDLWSDCDRNSFGEKIEDNAIDKAYALYRVIDPLLHRTRDAWWGGKGADPGMHVVSCVRGAEPFHEVAGAGSERPEFGDVAVVHVDYHVHTWH